MREIIKGVHNRHGEDLHIEIMDDTKSFYRTIEFKLIKNSCTVTSHCSFQVRNMKSQKGFVIELEQIDASDTFDGYGTILLENALKELLLEFDCDFVINGKIWIGSPTSEEKLRHFYSKFFTVRENYFRSEFKINNRIKDIEVLKNATGIFNKEAQYVKYEYEKESSVLAPNMPGINKNTNYPQTGNLVENMTFLGSLLILTSLFLSLRMRKKYK